MMSRWPRALVQSALLVGTLLVLSACSDDTTEPSVQPSEAKQSVIEFVEQSTTAAGGTWEHLSGPGVRECEQDSGAPGTMFVYVMKRTDTSGADARVDVQAVSKHWRDAGVDVDEYQSGGPDSVPGVRGRGGPVVSASFDASPGNYQMSATSKCSDGMPDQQRLEN